MMPHLKILLYFLFLFTWGCAFQSFSICRSFKEELRALLFKVWSPNWEHPRTLLEMQHPALLHFYYIRMFTLT